MTAAAEERLAMARQQAAAKGRRAQRRQRERAADDHRQAWKGELREQRHKLERATRAYGKALAKAIRTNREDDWDSSDLLMGEVLARGARIRQLKTKLRERA